LERGDERSAGKGRQPEGTGAFTPLGAGLIMEETCATSFLRAGFVEDRP
jgi:hypothetical protein